MDYFDKRGVDIEYLLSTQVNYEANLMYDGSVEAISSGGKATVLSIYSLTDNLVDGCKLSSMEYDDGRMWEVSPDSGFFRRVNGSYQSKVVAFWFKMSGGSRHGVPLYFTWCPSGGSLCWCSFVIGVLVLLSLNRG